jgi:hypothetical protein
MRTPVEGVIATMAMAQLGPGSTEQDRQAYRAYLAACLPLEVEADELKFFFEEAWDAAIRDWQRLIGPFYRH